MLVFTLLLLQIVGGSAVTSSPDPSQATAGTVNPSVRAERQKIGDDEIGVFTQHVLAPEPPEAQHDAIIELEEVDELSKSSVTSYLERLFSHGPADSNRAKRSTNSSSSGPDDAPFLATEFSRSLTRVPIGIVDTILEPVREANLLLPTPLDPFRSRDPSPLVPLLINHDQKPTQFSVSKQQAILGDLSTARSDLADGQAKWKHQLEAGGLFRQGNTAATNLNTQFRTERISNSSALQMKLGAVYNQTGTTKPNRRLYSQILYDRNLRGRWIAYAREEIDSDRAALIYVRSVSSVGLGFRFIDEIDQRWIVRTGPTYSYTLFEDASKQDNLRSGWLAESDFRRVLGEASRFEWLTTAYPDFDSNQNLRVRSDFAVLFPIGGTKSAWNWKIGLRHFYQLNPIQGARANDIEAYFTILYSSDKGMRSPKKTSAFSFLPSLPWSSAENKSPFP